MPLIPRYRVAYLLLLLSFATPGVVDAETDSSNLQVSPTAVHLNVPEAEQQLLVWRGSGRQRTDLTHQVRYRSRDESVAMVTTGGRVTPLADGETTIQLLLDTGEAIDVPVVVKGLLSPRPVSFRREVLPILTKAGCNSGGCHGKAEGQNGFRLSIFGFDAVADHNALVKQGRGRRVSLAAPESSLLLRKATGVLPHGGGVKIAPAGRWGRRLQRWIAEGGKLDDDDAPLVERIEVEPRELVMRANQSQQLRVTAFDSQGNQWCVTGEAEYQSNADWIAAADREGRVSSGDSPGEAAVLVRFMGQVAVCHVTLPQPLESFSRPQETNFVDRLAWNKLQRLGIQPSGPCDDATFLRRVYLDTIGTLPTAAEVRKFLDDNQRDKRARLIDELLERNEYADFWALKWADILRVDKAIVSPQGAVAMTRWLRRQMRDNTPYDQFARSIVTATGSTRAESPTPFFEVHKDPQMVGRAVSQVFLGVRIECAECHHHPFEKWSQADYFAFAGAFTGVVKKKSPAGFEKIIASSGADLKHPRSGEPVPAAGLGAEPFDLSTAADRRLLLAEWMTADDNPFFARMIANRLWAHYLGRGLVEPIDDLRATNPASNEPLLRALAEHVRTSKYDLKSLTRVILNSQVYQRSSIPNETNRHDVQNFSHAAWRPLPAEVLMDAISQVTQSPEQFNGWPTGVRAIQVWDNRMPSYFFKVFGRPQRVSVCECERGSEPSIAQSLHMMNSPENVRKIRDRSGLAAQLAARNASDADVIEHLYLTALSRRPTTEETALMTTAFDASRPRREAIEDVLWTLLNTKEFIYNH